MQKWCLVLGALVANVKGQPASKLDLAPSCINECLNFGKSCKDCVRILSKDMYGTPRTLELPFHKAHTSIPDPTTKIRHHNFLDRPPWVPGSDDEGHKPGDGKVVAEGKVHSNWLA